MTAVRHNTCEELEKEAYVTQAIEERFGALLAYPWEPSEDNHCEIHGRRAEDGSRYVVTCPEQVRDQLLHLQVQLYAQLRSLQEGEVELAERRRKLEHALLG
jgi:hypothetical protein